MINNKEFKNALSKANTMQEFLDICGEYYDLKNCKLNALQLGAMVANIDKLITVSCAKPKK